MNSNELLLAFVVADPGPALVLAVPQQLHLLVVHLHT